MITPTKDRLALLQALESVKTKTSKGLLAYAYSIKLYYPSSSDMSYDGIYGDTIQNLVGPAYAGAMADYFDCELKTHREDSSSLVTLGCWSSDDFDGPFVESRVYHKCRRMVVATLSTKGVELFSSSKASVPDMKIVDIYSVDMTDPKIFKLFEDDFEKLKDSWNRVQHTKGVETKYLALDHSANKKRWRMKQAAVRLLIGVDTLNSNPLFDL